jgi:sialic acid synthase SpsE
MCSLGEVEQAVNILRAGKVDGKIVVLHCTSEYPVPVNDVNLRAMLTMQQAFACPVGFSDHTAGIGASPWAVALGACVIEKHFTLDRNMRGPDHRASLESREFEELVRTVRSVELALGDGVKRPMPSEVANKPLMQKSLVTRRLIRAGDVIRPEDLACKRPGSGLTPAWFDRVVGQQVRRDIPVDSFLKLSDIDWTTS